MRVSIFAVALVLVLPGLAHAAPPEVLASIKPVHSIAAQVMDGVGMPQLLISGAASPHSYALKPSDARKLARARVVFWIGPAMETFLERPLAGIAARSVVLADAPGMILFAARSGGVWEDDPAHAEDGGLDGHLWLNPVNASAIARAMAETLAELDPDNAARYRANAQAFAGRMTALDGDLARQLAAARGRPYIVFHDAYRYFEERYGLAPAGAVTVAPDRPYGPRRIAELRARIRGAGDICLFAEPQFPPRLLETLREGTGARIATLDPLGADRAPGSLLYEATLRAMASDLIGCLAPP